MPRIGGSKIGGAHGWTHEKGGPDEHSIADLSGTSEELASHEADLDAHIKSFMELIRTGEYFPPLPVSGQSTVALGQDDLYGIPFVVARDLTIDRLGIDITSGNAGKSARLGIYNNGTNLKPGTLLLDAGTLSIASTGTVAVTVNQALTKGLYWLAILPEAAVTVIAWLQAFPMYGFASNDFGFTSQYSHWRKLEVGYGALPDPFPTDAVQNNSYAICIFPRLKSLD